MTFWEKAQVVILDGLKNHLGKIVSVPLAMSSLIFAANLLLAISDGIITEDEFHSLVSMASGSQTLILLFVMAVLKLRK